MPDSAVPIALLDNERVHVTLWRLPQGTSTGWHRHELDFLVIPLTTGHLKLSEADGSHVQVELEAGAPSFQQAGGEHDVTNVGEAEFRFIEIEVK
jgi:quercetin dioxygenase-like cupin family protein